MDSRYSNEQIVKFESEMLKLNIALHTFTLTTEDQAEKETIKLLYSNSPTVKHFQDYLSYKAYTAEPFFAAIELKKICAAFFGTELPNEKTFATDNAQLPEAKRCDRINVARQAMQVFAWERCIQDEYKKIDGMQKIILTKPESEENKQDKNAISTASFNNASKLLNIDSARHNAVLEQYHTSLMPSTLQSIYSHDIVSLLNDDVIPRYLNCRKESPNEDFYASHLFNNIKLEIKTTLLAINAYREFKHPTVKQNKGMPLPLLSSNPKNELEQKPTLTLKKPSQKLQKDEEIIEKLKKKLEELRDSLSLQNARGKATELNALRKKYDSKLSRSIQPKTREEQQEFFKLKTAVFPLVTLTRESQQFEPVKVKKASNNEKKKEAATVKRQGSKDSIHSTDSNSSAGSTHSMLNRLNGGVTSAPSSPKTSPKNGTVGAVSQRPPLPTLNKIFNVNARRNSETAHGTTSTRKGHRRNNAGVI